MKLSIALGDEKFVNICFDKRVCHGDVNSSRFVFSPFKRNVETMDAITKNKVNFWPEREITSSTFERQRFFLFSSTSLNINPTAKSNTYVSSLEETKS